MNDYAVILLVAIAGFILGFTVAVKSIDALVSTRCDEIGVVSLGNDYYNCAKRP